MLSNLLKSFKYAFSGIYFFYREEPHALVHTLAAVAAIGVSVYSDLSTSEWLWIILSIVLVFAFEMMNTALEVLANRVTTENDELIKKSKDISAGATLVVSIFAVVTAALVILPKWI